METYLSIEMLAEYLLLAEQTIRRWVLNREIPFHKIKKVIRFRLSEIEKWIDGGGMDGRVTPEPEETGDGDLFAGVETGEAGGADGEAGESAAEIGEAGDGGESTVETAETGETGGADGEAGENTGAGGAMGSDDETGGVE